MQWLGGPIYNLFPDWLARSNLASATTLLRFSDMKATVIIYSRPGCHLCDVAKAVMRSAHCESRYTLEEINIEDDLALLDLYRNDIPVITVNGIEAFRHRITVDQFRTKLSDAMMLA